MKYLVMIDREGGEQVFCCFPPISHADFSKALTALGYCPISAGYVRFNAADQAETFGFSDSLQLGARAQDAAMINAQLSISLRLGALSEKPHQPCQPNESKPSP